MITLDRASSRSSAVLVQNDRIIAIGGDELRHLAPESARYDLRGSSVVPGFNDAHNHMMAFGLGLEEVFIGYPEARCIEDILQLVERRAKQVKPGAWIVCTGYDENRLAEKRPPTALELDSRTPQNPVVLKQNSCHMIVANSAALRLCGIDQHTPDPNGGRIVKDASGRPTGLLQESAQHLVLRHTQDNSTQNLVSALERASCVMLEEGITSCHEAGVGNMGPQHLKAFMRAREQEKLGVRVYLMISVAALHEIQDVSGDEPHLGLDQGIYTGLGDEWLKIGPVKMFADGSLIGRTCALDEPYQAEPHNRGFFVTQPTELRKKIIAAHRSGWQIAVHAIGDRAIGSVLDAYEEALILYPRKNHRHRIEHAGVLNPRLIAKFANLEVIPVPQPSFIWELGDGFVRVLGRQRADMCYPLKSLADSGLCVPGSSDRPVTNGAPLMGIHAAVNQVTQSGKAYCTDQAVSAEQALRFYTQNSAYASFEENLKGSIEPGKLADMVVLDEDPTDVPAQQIMNVRVLATIVGGKPKFTRDGWSI